MSASVLPSQRADALAAGADLFLPKPFAQPELLDALAQLLKVTWLAGETTALTEGAANGVRLPAPVVPTVPVPRDLLAEFSELATLGDIAALQALVEKLAASPGQAELAAELGALINAFELAALRQRLAALRAG
jgi:CheY-like chemotaxis protein